MTTLDRIPPPAPTVGPIPPALVRLPEEGRLGPTDAANPPRLGPDEILPTLMETPAWPRVFPSL